MSNYQHTMTIAQFFSEYMGAEDITQANGVIEITFKTYDQGIKEKAVATITPAMDAKDIVDELSKALRDVEIDTSAYEDD